MNAGSKEEKDDEDSSTKQVVEYYQKFSQSRELPKYFSGTSLAYLPQIVDDEGKQYVKLDMINNPQIIITEEKPKYGEYEPEQDLELSPTGSLASNRKLEWDNLGDIGYNNAKIIQRSVSLPILTQKKSSKTEGQLKGSSVASSNVKLVILPYTSSSSEEKSSEKNTLGFSSSSSPIVEKEFFFSDTITTNSGEKQKLFSDTDSYESNQKIVSFKQSIGYLKKKIGLPDAQSTPNESENVKDMFEKLSDTPHKKKSEKPIKTLIKPNKNVLPNKTVPKSDQAADTENDIALNPPKKVINLYLTKPILLDCISKTNHKQLTIGIQTDEIPKPNVPPNELVTIYKHSDTLKTSSDSAKSTSSNAIASKCDSFEYVKNNSNPKENTENNFVENNDGSKKNDKCEENKTNSEKSEASQDVHPVGPNLRTTDNDIESHIYVLQRLIKSKKYDSSTKRKYIKKLLQKITESKYLEDSSASSDLFYPKTDPTKILHDQLKHSSFKNDKSSSSSHDENKPLPKKKLSDSTDSEIFHPKVERKLMPSKTDVSKLESKPSSSNLKKDTKHSQKKKSDTDVKPSECTEPKKTPFTVTQTQDLPFSEKSSPQSFQNWKELKTISEKLLESTSGSSGGGDQLARFADREREYQLNWIDREINHLAKLKRLLEKPSKPHLPGNIKPTTTTSVYMVTGSGGNDLQRNYVIETQLGVGSSQQRNFRLNGENYIVQDQNRQMSGTKPRPVAADIQVNSTDKVTNIKVRTFCNVCKRSPCICVTDSLQGLTDRFGGGSTIAAGDLTKNRSTSESCSCNTTSTSSSTKTSSRTICLVCHKYPCTCCSCKKPHDLKTCSVCRLYTCMCGISPKDPTPVDPYVGTFLPASRLTPTEKPNNSQSRNIENASVASRNWSLKKSERSVCGKCRLYPCVCIFSSIQRFSGSSSLKKSSGTSEDNETCSRCGAVRCCCETTRNKSSEGANPCVCTKKLEKKPCQRCGGDQCFCDVSRRSPSRKSDGSVCRKCGFSPCVCSLSSGSSTKRSLKIMCPKCGTFPCHCTSEKKISEGGHPPYICNSSCSSKSSYKKESAKSSAKSSMNSLSKVFADCKCGPSGECSCNFVEKLLRHFVGGLPLEKKDAKSTEVQTNSDTKPSEFSREAGTESSEIVKDVPTATNYSQTKTLYNTDEMVQTAVPNTCIPNFQEFAMIPSRDTATQSSARTLEKATSPEELPATVDKCVGRLRGECGSQCYQVETVDETTSPRVRTVDNYTDQASRKSSVDRSTSPGRFSIDKSVDARPRAPSVDQGSSPIISHVSRGSSAKVEALDHGTSSATSGADKSVDVKGEEELGVFSYVGKDSPANSVLTNSSSDCSCCCCGTRVSWEGISMLRSNDKEFPVCKKCLKKRPVLTTICFAGPEEEDSSATSSRTKTTEDHFRRAEGYCTCKRGSKSNKLEYCPHCRNRLKRTQRSRNGIAYTLTLEEESPEKFKRPKKNPKKLEEIKIKVPNPYSRKHSKNRENNQRKDENKMKRLESGENSENEEIYYSTNNDNNTKTQNNNDVLNNKKQIDQHYTLQEYLQRNRPGFVDAAEYRRLALINNKIERELNKDDLKLKFLERNAHNNILKHQKLFTEQEMREITKRNYKKLPEVQQKLIDRREQKLRSADKFMADLLKRKIQNCVLKGKSSFPLDTNVVNGYK